MPLLLLVITCFARVTAVGTIKPMFETSSTAEYNQWLEEHRNEYPDFQPIGTISSLFFDSGAVLPSKVLEFQAKSKDLVGMQTPYVRFVDYPEYCLVHYGSGRDAATAVYDQHGLKLFECAGNVLHRFGMWFRDVEDSMAAWRRFHPEIPAALESTEVLDNTGKVIGVIPRATVWRATRSGDTLIAAVASGGALVFDRGAKVRWQDSMFGNATRLVAISPDAGKVAVVTRDSMCVHDMTTGTNKVLPIPSVAVTGYRTHLVVWSTDSRRFAIYRADSYGPSAAVLWTFTRDGKLVAKPRRLDANYGEQLFWMGDTVVLATTPYVDSIEERLRDKHWFVGPSRVTAVPPRGRVRTWMVGSRFGEDSHWFQQGRCLACVSGGYAAAFEVPIR